MSRPVAIIQWPAGVEFTGEYKYKGRVYINSPRAQSQCHLSIGGISRLVHSGRVRYLKVLRGNLPVVYLYDQQDIAHIPDAGLSQPERYRKAERQQAPNGKWYLAARAFCRFVGTSGNTLFNRWRVAGVPVLDYAPLDTHKFREGNGRHIDFYSEDQARKIIEAREAIPPNLQRAAVAAKRCNVDERYVKKLAKRGAIEAEMRPTAIGRRSRQVWFVDVDSLREFLRLRKREKEPQTISDPISVKEAARLCETHPPTMLCWIREGKIEYEKVRPVRGGAQRFVLSRQKVLAFAEVLRQTRGAGGTEEWLHRRQVRIQFPNVTPEILRRYRNEVVPLLGRPLRSRLVDRPPGLKCRSPQVRQWWTEDTRQLAEWLEGGDHNPHGANAAPHPVNGQAAHVPETEAAPMPRLRRGRKKGVRDPEVVRREREMLAAWDRREFGSNKAATGAAFGFYRQDATKLINDHERKKSDYERRRL
jgi:hypothetical protein